LNIGLVYLLVKENMLANGPVDRVAELDTVEGITALQRGFEASGHRVVLVEATGDIYAALRSLKNQVDIVFSVSEGLSGESRESLVPLLCESLDIPYIGSGPLTLALCLDKARTKEILTHHRLPTPRFQVIRAPNDRINSKLRYPLILKLNEDGSSKGLAYDSVVSDEIALRRKATYLFDTYAEKILVEEYIEGREFTVPVLGNLPPIALPVIELIFDRVPPGQPRINLFVPEGSVIEMLTHLHREVSINSMNHSTICPARIDVKLEKKIKRLAIQAYQALGCRDWCRMEFRLDANNNLFILELNPIAGIDPSFHFPLSARIYGLDYPALLDRIVGYAIERYQLRADRRIIPDFLAIGSQITL
jgi:D-alanine-D-alanine ligase